MALNDQFEMKPMAPVNREVGPTVALFPGQGSQHVGMLKELHGNFRIVRETFEEGSDAIHEDIAELCFNGPENRLVLTENTQPCLLIASIAAFRAAGSELGFRPDFVAGHSLGEYSALVAAGSLALGTATRWVRERGLAMQRAVPPGQGTMAAVLNLDDERIRNLCAAATESARAKREAGDAPDLSVEPIVEPANFNAPGQIVIAGSADAVAEAIALIKSGGAFGGAKAIPLQVSAPFHCKLMAPARNRMAEIFSRATDAELPLPPSVPYVPNRTARVTREACLIFELLIEQVDHPVLWKQSIEALIQGGARSVVEFGPGKVLTGLVKRISQPMGQTPTLFQLSESSHLKALETALGRV